MIERRMQARRDSRALWLLVGLQIGLALTLGVVTMLNARQAADLRATLTQLQQTLRMSGDAPRSMSRPQMLELVDGAIEVLDSDAVMYRDGEPLPSNWAKKTPTGLADYRDQI